MFTSLRGPDFYTDLVQLHLLKMPSVFQWKRAMRKCNTIQHMKGLPTINSFIPEYQKSRCVPLCLRETL
ncbi:hypothetical protein CKAN_00651600 [Cinnamomum micranthum f. kanehirae]|uniref:Uncharacterized protein n=1 Tax=Cinnamomum micranthum f. kanehirae TaxID=337451 RepID=A0A3S3MDW3_9MAGN|nr:hypothetical protein CKAN_00651600 [Cinnamomum micranthum f. kanehirae]